MSDKSRSAEAEPADSELHRHPPTPPPETPPGMDPMGLASASRSCLVILILLTITALLICVSTVIRVIS